MAILSKIRRWYYRDQLSLREIARRTGYSRNTIRRYLRNETLEPEYSRRQSTSKLDAYTDKLTQWLESNTRVSRKQRRTIKQLHADLSALGFDGSYDRVAKFAQKWRQEQLARTQTAGKRTYIPLIFSPGEAFQFDWSEDFAEIDGERVKLQIAHVKLSYSRAFLLRAYWQITHEMLFDAHYHAFKAWGGIPERGIYDNMKTAVDKVQKGKLRMVNGRFSAMLSHYLFEADFCNPPAGREKGQVEKNVQDARHRIWQKVPPHPSLESLNQWLFDYCQSLWNEILHPTEPVLISTMLERERTKLMPVGHPFDGYIEHTKRVSTTSLITFERNRYSVPATFANRSVSLHVYPDRLEVIAENQRIAEHTRLFNRQHLPGRTVYDWRHYLSVLKRKPGALRNGEPFTELPLAFKNLQTILLKRPGGDREMVDVLALILLHEEQVVLTAVELALETGAPSKNMVMNILSRLVDNEPVPLVEIPKSLILKLEPVANVDRYNSLLVSESRGQHVD